MIYLNIEFQEEYKRLDALCKDMLSSSNGISEYLQEMDLTPYVFRRCVSSWDADYQRLKNLRHIRNKLAHEIGSLNYDQCTQDDIIWLQEFYKSILNCADPLAIVRRVKKSQTQQIRKTPTIPHTESPRETEKTIPTKEEKKVSLWKKIILKIKSIFS